MNIVKSLCKLSIVAVLFAIYGCEEVMIMIPEFEIPKTARTVLIEDLTGVQCPNCPKGSAAIEEILATFPGQVFAIGIHGLQQTAPLPENKYDFRNKFAEDLELFHRPFLGKPSASINRRLFNNEDNIPVDNIGVWSSYVLDELNQPEEATIVIEKTYDPTSRLITINTSILPLIEETGDFRVSVFVTESEIEDAQEDQAVIIEDYIHEHVLRHMMTNFDGDRVADNIKEGDNIKRTFTYTLPSEFNADHIEVIVSFHRNGTVTQDRSILQSAGMKLK